jgi:drug/metabolite transporter (DMT)-like permease
MSRQAWVLFVTISLLWGLPYLLIKVAVSELDAAAVAFGRVAISTLVLLPVALAQGALKPFLARWRAVLGLAMIEVVAPFLLIANGEQHISSSLAGLLIAADPLFVAVLAMRFNRAEGVTGFRLVGLLVGLLGVGVLLGIDLRGDALGLLGAGMVLVAALSYAGGALLIKNSFSDVPPLGGVAASLAVATVVLAPLAAVSLPAQWPSAQVLVSMLALGLVCTARAFLVYFSLIAVAGPARAALITYINPAVAVVLGAVVLHEPITVVTVVGFVLILAGCWWSTGGRLPRRRHGASRLVGRGAVPGASQH